MTQKWKQRPPGSNRGEFGPEDQLGRLNYLTEENTLKAAREIRTGKRFCPGLPLNEPCLFKLGIHLGEMWYFTELAEWLDANGGYRFFMTAPPLHMPGAVGSPANPIGTV